MKGTHDNIGIGRELREEELRKATGGFYDIEFCGTVPRRFPPRPPTGITGFEAINPVVLQKQTIGR